MKQLTNEKFDDMVKWLDELGSFATRRQAPLFTPEHPCPPKPLPLGVNAWHFHQTTQRGASIGAPAMRTMDYNRFNGTPTQFYAYIELPQPNVGELVTCPLDGEPCSGGKIIERL